MPVTIGTGNEQNALTVNRLLEDPLMVPELMRTFFRGQFIADQILRPAGKATGGAVQFWVSGPVYPDVAAGDAEVVAPLAEIPVANPIVGTPASAQVKKRGLGLRISREMADRNNVGAVMRGLDQIRNAIVRSVDGALMTAIQNAITQTVSVTTPWDAASGTTIRKDVQAGKALVETLQDTGYQYDLDTLLINRRTRDDLIVAAELAAPYVGAVAGQNPLLATGQSNDLAAKLAQVLGFQQVLVSPQVLTDHAYGIQRNVVGGIADERGTPGQPIEVSAPYEEKPYEATRWDVTRAAAGFVDNPGAIVDFSNVET
jgi:hypothetical protein